MAEREVKRWITINGRHIPIYEDSSDTEDRYVRFGEIPAEEESANFLSLSRDQNERVSYYMRQGMTPREALEKAGINPKGKFENGVSSFFLDDEGLPRLETASQLRTFYWHTYMRVGTDKEEAMFSYNGSQSGIGTDGEPIVKGLQSARQYKLTPDKVKRTYEKTFDKNYGKKTAMTETEKQMYPYHLEFPMYEGGLADSSVAFYDGYKYEEPIESFGAKTIKHRRKVFKTLR